MNTKENLAIMRVEFLLNNINNYDKLYTFRRDESILDESPVTISNYEAKEYCEEVLKKVMKNISSTATYHYQGCLDRIANETFILDNNGEKAYTITFTIDTYDEKKKARLKVNIADNLKEKIKTESNPSVKYILDDGSDYDLYLEQLKIGIKDVLKNDWHSCTWIMDDQSEILCSQLYPSIFKTENLLRAFVAKVLMYHIGTEWLRQSGMEIYAKSVESLSDDFKRTVPVFEGIDDAFISMTLETMMKIIKKGKIYESQIDISGEEFEMIFEKLKSEKARSLHQFFQEKRKVKKDYWNDIFKEYFELNESLITNFIKNRNHIAHNKLLNWSGFQKMKMNIQNVEEFVRKANADFEAQCPSEELISTMEYEEESERQKEEWERDYLKIRIQGETGVDIRSEEEIFEMFTEALVDIYTEISDKYYFDPCYEIDEICELDDTKYEQAIFKVTSCAMLDSSIEVSARIFIDDSMDGDSNIVLKCMDLQSGTELFRNTLHYHNGNGYEDSFEGTIVLESESYFEDNEKEDFIIALCEYIEEKLNPLVSKKNMLEYEAVRHGGELPTADFTCEECGKDGISILENFYPIGRCCYCGTENEVHKCEMCGKIFDDYGGKNGICNGCLPKDY